MKLKNTVGVLLRGAVIATAFSFVSASAHAQDLLETVKSSGVLRVGLEGTYPPFDYKNASGELEGFDVDVAKAVAARLGVKP
ncbi:putative amino-acid ABC transporter-binding protein HI_1080 (fragment) [Paraburkholderia ribeironis]|uniref:Putative amino-acid ABC transporter-binding protein HI_1080 n=1 Tax=Paraburkholderia ribeironis TaxID=1247936 RepID=A0A1N7SHZ6_9BURK